MYDGDSFFNLTSSGQTGLALLSAFLTAAMLVAARRLFRLVPDKGLPLQLAARLGVAVFIMWVFIWLSPQAYYLHYQMIFDGLPWQLVIRNPPEFHVVIVHITFSGPATLAGHAKGALTWLLILYAAAWPVFQHLRQTQVRPPRT